MIGDIQYGNSGDWVESCSALVEHEDGDLEVIYWSTKGAVSSIEARNKA